MNSLLISVRVLLKADTLGTFDLLFEMIRVSCRSLA